MSCLEFEKSKERVKIMCSERVEDKDGCECEGE